MTFKKFTARLLSGKVLPRTAILLACVFIGSCGGSSTSSGGTGTDPNGFSKLLGPTFTNPRCQNCHGFETENQTKIRHREQDRLSRDCGECHFTPGWEAPFQSFSFSNISTTEICVAIKNKTGNDLQALKDSVINSTLAQWAIIDGGFSDGAGQSGTFSTAPPGNMAEMARLIDQWIAAGASCD